MQVKNTLPNTNLPQPAAAKQTGLIGKLAAKFGVEADSFTQALVRVAFPSEQKISPAEMLALLVVCDQYELNPFLRQIYAFKSRSGSIVPLVGIDGWMAIINRHPDYKGMKIEMAEKRILIDGVSIPEWCDCTILNRRLDTPITMREYADEAFVRSSPVWRSHPKRMLRNRAIVQCARIAFALGGIQFMDNERNPWETMEAYDAVPAAAPVMKAAPTPRPAISRSRLSDELLQSLFEQGMKTGNWQRIDQYIDMRVAPEDKEKARAYIAERRGAQTAKPVPAARAAEPIEDAVPAAASSSAPERPINDPADDDLDEDVSCLDGLTDELDGKSML